jgi:cytochrome P450
MEIFEKISFINYLFSAKDPETGNPAYSPDELNAEARLLLLAGAETTSTALCATLFYLTRNLRAYRRVTSEIRDTFTNSQEIREGSKISSCHYLKACIDEAMRMTPSGPGEQPIDVLKGGLELDGVFLPEGTRVGTSTWALFHNERYFGDAWTYRPERWIVDDDLGITPGDVALAQSAYNPFLIGPYNCVGQKLAMQELMLTTAKILYQMDVKAAPGNSLGGGSPELGWGRRNPNHFHVRDGFISVKDGPMIQFRRRQFSQS